MSESRKLARIGNRVRVTAQLIDATSAAHIWAERYDRGLDDIFAIQDEVTEAVVARIAEGIKGARALHARSRPSHSATAYDLVLQARPYRTAYTAAASKIAARLLRQATELDPNFALAHASLAFVRTGEFEEGWTGDPDAVLAEALAAAKRAVALDDSDGYAHASLAYVLLKFGEFDHAEHEIGVALSLNPNHVNIIMTSGWVSIVNCDPERAIEMIKRARRLNPFMGGWGLWTLGQAYLDAKRYQDALDSFAKVPSGWHWQLWRQAMATNLVSLVMDVLTPDIIARIAAALGLDRGAAQKAIGAAVPALLAAFAGSAAKPGGAGRLFDAVNQQGSGVLTNLAKTLDGSGPTALAERGSGLLASPLGGSTQSELANAVGKFAGISEGKGASLLGILGPIAMGALRKQQTASGLDASGLANLLASQGSNISAALPSGFANLLGGTDVLDSLGGRATRPQPRPLRQLPQRRGGLSTRSPRAIG